MYPIIRQETKYLITSVAKRAETRPCPVCEELIPLRLMAVHLDLELGRVEEIIKAVGSSDVFFGEGYVQLQHPSAGFYFLDLATRRPATVVQLSKPVNL